MCSGDVPRGESGRRASKDQSGTWETRRGGCDSWSLVPNDRRESNESITAGRLRRESEGFIVARKPDNSGGAKGPCRDVFPQEVRRTAWINPLRNMGRRTWTSL